MIGMDIPPNIEPSLKKIVPDQNNTFKNEEKRKRKNGRTSFYEKMHFLYLLKFFLEGKDR